MVETLSHSQPTARKEHECMAYVWIDNSDLSGCGLTFAELRAIAKAKASKGKILIGQIYDRSIIKQDGQIHTFKAIPELLAICNRLELFEDC